ncbi:MULTISPECIES: C40 family peptidase [Leeuwenhoekiella]|uniref:NlpC/P60 family protein n=1 Tax=Leeuwenhoekiella aequorea TaxID=283736 RepID=A0A4V1KQW6_9FLAO|nr:C40 family peptidase [Leeuwenhoekiella aequorea]RXG22842.1 NlpC/P60 family protein [Leeuwenhoekiella aequorea]|tara:strand:- start:7166 stop:7762 length:597 start_codon:yes stop_codon:yes gene_type:complete
MIRVFFALLLSLALISCGSSHKSITTTSTISKTNKKTRYVQQDTKPIISSPETKQKRELIYLSEIEVADENRLRYNIINNARQFEGTPYKYGGTTDSGMDCSGLVYTAFLQESVSIPRVSRSMAQEGERVAADNVTPGDLLFFVTGRKSKHINHVGLVVDVLPGQVLFIHSSTSQGVIVSSLNEGYWNNAFKEARKYM